MLEAALSLHRAGVTIDFKGITPLPPPTHPLRLMLGPCPLVERVAGLARITPRTQEGAGLLGIASRAPSPRGS